MRRLLLPTTLLFFLLFTGNAKALYLDAAERAWPGHPCAGQATLQFVDAAPRVRAYVLLRRVNDVTKAPADCIIRVNRSWWSGAGIYDRCLTVVHEVGHWMGLDDEPSFAGSIMSQGDHKPDHPACGKRPAAIDFARAQLRMLNVGPVWCRPRSCWAGARHYRLTITSRHGYFLERIN